MVCEDYAGYGSQESLVYFGAEEEDVEALREQRGHFFAMIRDANSIGCKCYTNHWQELNADQLETLMMNIASMTKMKRKQYILGSWPCLQNPLKLMHLFAEIQFRIES